MLTTTIVNVAIPGIMADFDMGQMQAQWLSTGFLAAMTATMLTSARVMERFGQRRTFMSALVLFLCASLLAAASWNASVMVVARILQGAIAGVIQPLALVVIFQAFPAHERGRALGLYGMGVVLAPAIGPTVGGVLLDAFGWRAVYLAAIPFALIGLYGARRYLPGPAAAARVPFDWWGLVWLIAGLGLLLTGLVALETPHGIAQAGLGVVMLVVFVVHLRRAQHPLVALVVFESRMFTLAVVLALIYGGGLFASTYLIPLLAQGVQGLSATATGLVMMPAGLALAAIFPWSGGLADRYPGHWLIITGLLVFAGALSGLAVSDPQTGFWVLASWVLLGRVGLGVMLPAVNLNALRDMPEDRMQQASGVINFARMLGGAFGVNLFALLLEARVTRHLAAGPDVGFDMHRFYAAAGGAAEAPPQAVAALTQAFGDTFIVLAMVFLLAVIPAAAMGVRHARIQHRSSGL